MRPHLILISLISIGFTAPTVQAAGAKKQQFELSPFIGYRMGGDFDHEVNSTESSIELEDTTSLGAVLAWNYDGKRQGELLFSHYSTEFSNQLGDSESTIFESADIGVSYLHLGGNVPIASGALPFWLSGGLGISYIKPDDNALDDETHFSMNLGLHTQVNLSDQLALKIGARGYGTFFDSDSEIFCNNANCTITVSSEVWLQGELHAGLVFKF